MFGNLQLDQHMVTKNMTPYEVARSGNTHLFWKLFVAARWHALWARLQGKRHQLLSLSDEQDEQTVNGRYYLGVQTVPLNEIVGSEGRENDFDAEFRPRQRHNMDRWLGVAAVRQLDKPLPPVDLIQVGSHYFVRDGHHRVSVARARGEWEIDALVTRWQIR